MGDERFFPDDLRPISDDLKSVFDDLSAVSDDLERVSDDLTLTDDDLSSKHSSRFTQSVTTLREERTRRMGTRLECIPSLWLDTRRLTWERDHEF